MLAFIEWVVYRDALDQLRFLEAAEFFRPQDYNAVFEAELEKLLIRIHDPDARRQLESLGDFDWANYIVRSLARAGIRGEDVQENLHDITIRLLLSPGKLFRGWEPSRHGPLERRFRASVWNAIRNIAEKRSNYRRWMVAVDPTSIAERNPAREPSSGVLEQFRRLVMEKLGKLAAAILDWRLEGRQTKEMVGKPEFGSPSKYNIKREVQAIKHLAHQFAAQSGDPAFLARVERAIAGEAETVAKRQAAGRG